MLRTLSKSYLLANGFAEAGCWSASEHRLILSENLPYERGVYAFVVDDAAVYVGVASRSLRQRLGFYCRPDASQRTNIRLNALIRNLIADDTGVHIFIAQPPNSMWNGFRMSGPEGLEAALIEDFDLP